MPGSERKAGNSRLVYNKATRTIDTVRNPLHHECGPGGETYEPPYLGVPGRVLDAMAHAIYEPIGTQDMEGCRRLVEMALLAAAGEGFAMAGMPRKAKTIAARTLSADHVERDE